MVTISTRKGAKRGEYGITIVIKRVSQKKEDREATRTITVKGLTIQQVYEKLTFFLKGLEVADAMGGALIEIEGVDYKKKETA